MALDQIAKVKPKGLLTRLLEFNNSNTKEKPMYDALPRLKRLEERKRATSMLVTCATFAVIFALLSLTY